MAIQQTAALYCRISRDDERSGDSASIETQKNMLEQYAKSKSFAYYFYIDDGYSGTNFDRPGFNQMISDIQEKKIEIVIVKDLSRLGRDYLKTGYYIDLYFDENNVRYISLNDGIDSANGDSEFIPFRNIINEWHSRDLSRKVRAAYRTKSLNGQFTAAYAPYGYMKNPDNKNQLIVDKNTAVHVKRIFQMAADGVSPHKIATLLTSESILTPRAYIATNEGKYKDALKHPTNWNHGTIQNILHNREYLGHLVSGCSTTKSFKDRKPVRLSKEDWIEVKNTHEPIIDEKLFYTVQNNVVFRERKDYSTNIFSGLLKCSDCGSNLTFIKPRNEGHQGAFNCSLYRRKCKCCTAHYITHHSLHKMVLDDIGKHIKILKQHENELTDYAKQLSEEYMKDQTKYLEQSIEKAQKRFNEIEMFKRNAIEKNTLGYLSDNSYSTIMEEYENEQDELKNRIKDLQNQITTKKKDTLSFESLTEIVREYTDVKALSTTILRGLIEKIVVHNAKTVSDRKHQKIEIYYKFTFTDLCSQYQNN